MVIRKRREGICRSWLRNGRGKIHLYSSALYIGQQESTIYKPWDVRDGDGDPIRAISKVALVCTAIRAVFHAHLLKEYFLRANIQHQASSLPNTLSLCPMGQWCMKIGVTSTRSEHEGHSKSCPLNHTETLRSGSESHRVAIRMRHLPFVDDKTT